MCGKMCGELMSVLPDMPRNTTHLRLDTRNRLAAHTPHSTTARKNAPAAAPTIVIGAGAAVTVEGLSSRSPPDRSLPADRPPPPPPLSAAPSRLLALSARGLSIGLASGTAIARVARVAAGAVVLCGLLCAVTASVGTVTPWDTATPWDTWAGRSTPGRCPPPARLVLRLLVPSSASNATEPY
eukprot:scaffold107668_cov63-Phaeocystis_antarctica.AAC.1